MLPRAIASAAPGDFELALVCRLDHGGRVVHYAADSLAEALRMMGHQVTVHQAPLDALARLIGSCDL